MNQLAYSPKEHSLMQKLHTKLMAFTLPMLMAEVISMTFYGKWDDEDDDGYVDDAVWANLLLGSQIRGGLAMAPYIGPSLVNLYEMGINDRAYGDRVVSSPAQATVMRALQGLMQMGRTIADEDKALSGRTLRDTITAGVLFLPYGGAAAAPFAKPIAWTTGVVTGKTEPTGFWDTVRGFVTGYASEESRK
jgi:hypothetical protein